MLTRLRKYFLSGLVVFLPIALTIYFFILLINFAENSLGRYLRPYFSDNFGFYVSGFSIIVGIFIIIIIGFLATNFVGRTIYNFFDDLLTKLPFFKQVYPALKEMATFLFTDERMNRFRQVVLIEYPRKGVYAIGFLTNDTSQMLQHLTDHKNMCNVFIPSAPGPLTGYVVLMPRKEIIFTDISIEQAFKFILSGGVVNPPSQGVENNTKE